MAIFKCKMCGGTIEFEPGSTVGVCEYCETKQTLPKLDDDKKANLYDRANHFRRSNDFDKAANIYEQILAEDNTDSEAYWSLVLCRYGIEYVEDPSTHKRIPTVNRAQFTSIYADEDYKSAIEYADNYQKEIYELEAKQIDEIQKGILAISNKEEPFDIFICYKETDNNGRRTMDSVLANDLYHQLVQEGFKVFFSRITLEDKLGTAYEPYIFAALNSSKVMVVLGTKPEYFNAVWVKNEWSRYLSLVKQSKGKKVLIPAYRDMDPYDLPEEFSHLQALDMSKLGFMQDLIRGIKKIIQTDTPTPTIKETIITNNNNNTNTAPLLKRVFMFLEDGNFTEADEYCEKVLDIDPENAEAYLGKLMVELQVKKQESLKDQAQPFDDNSNYQKVIRFGDEKLSSTLSGYVSYINERNETIRITNIYDDAVATMNEAEQKKNENASTSAELYKEAADKFESITGFKDSDTLSKKCLEEAEICRKDGIYNSALSLMNGTTVVSLEKAAKSFQSIPCWKDSDEQVLVCKNKIEEIKAKEEAERLQAKLEAEKAAKKRKKIIKNVSIIVVVAILLTTVAMPLISKSIFISKYGKETYDMLGVVKKGSTIKFGTYEQDNNTSNGKEEIEWLVLEIRGEKALLISEYGLDCQPYNTKQEDVTWKTCSLRNWLNKTFYSQAFSSEERLMIADSTVTADKNPEYNTNPGNDTTDKIFLLSITEAKKYFSSDSERICTPTAYAKAKGAYESDSGSCWWLLRSPGHNQFLAAIVDTDGSIDYYGYSVHVDSGCVRPALWINLES